MAKALGVRNFVKRGLNFIFLLFMFTNFAIKYKHLNFIDGDILLVPVLIGLVFFLFFMKGEKLLSLFIQFRLFAALVICFAVYYIFLDPLKGESAVYLFAKTSLFIMFALIMSLNSDEYKRSFLKVTAIIVLLSCIYGTFSQTVDAENLRLSFGFVNVNGAGTCAAISFGIILQNKFFPKYFAIPAMIFLAYVVFMTGSRGALVVLVIAVFFSDLRRMPIYKYLLLLVPLLVALPFLSRFVLQTNSSNSVARMLGGLTGKESMFSNRDHAYTYGIKTFMDEIFMGHGLARYGWTDPIFSAEGLRGNPHNGYLSLGIMMGVVFGLVFIVILLRYYVVYLFDFFSHRKEYLRTYFFIATSVILNTFVESYLVGINELVTSLFWYSMAVIQFDYYFVSRTQPVALAGSKSIQFNQKISDETF